MKFKNTNSGFVGVLVLIIIVAVVSGGGVYMYQKNKLKTDVSGNYEYPTSTTDISVETNTSAKITSPDLSIKIVPSEVKSVSTISVNGGSISVKNGEKVIQTISVNSNALSQSSQYIKTFILDTDVNFDGHNDIGVFSSSAYSGVTIYYEYYLYDPKTGKFEKSVDLDTVAIVKIDPVKKQLFNTVKSGPRYETQIITWNGSGYVKSEFKSEF